MIIDFITGLAWVFGILSTLLVIIAFIWAFKYSGSAEEMKDRAKGIKKSWDAKKPFIIAVICWVWIFTV